MFDPNSTTRGVPPSSSAQIVNALLVPTTAIVAAVAAGDSIQAQELADPIQSENPAIRSAAVSDLVKTKSSREVLDTVKGVLRTDPSHEVRSSAVRILSKLKVSDQTISNDIRHLTERALRDPHPEVRATAARFFAKDPGELCSIAVDRLIRLLDDDFVQVTEAAQLALRRHNVEVAPFVATMLRAETIPTGLSLDFKLDLTEFAGDLLESLERELDGALYQNRPPADPRTLHSSINTLGNALAEVVSSPWSDPALKHAAVRALDNARNYNSIEAALFALNQNESGETLYRGARRFILSGKQLELVRERAMAVFSSPPQEDQEFGLAAALLLADPRLDATDFLLESSTSEQQKWLKERAAIALGYNLSGSEVEFGSNLHLDAITGEKPFYSSLNRKARRISSLRPKSREIVFRLVKLADPHESSNNGDSVAAHATLSLGLGLGGRIEAELPILEGILAPRERSPFTPNLSAATLESELDFFGVSDQESLYENERFLNAAGETLAFLKEAKSYIGGRSYTSSYSLSQGGVLEKMASLAGWGDPLVDDGVFLPVLQLARKLQINPETLVQSRLRAVTRRDPIAATTAVRLLRSSLQISSYLLRGSRGSEADREQAHVVASFRPTIEREIITTLSHPEGVVRAAAAAAVIDLEIGGDSPPAKLFDMFGDPSPEVREVLRSKYHSWSSIPTSSDPLYDLWPVRAGESWLKSQPEAKRSVVRELLNDDEEIVCFALDLITSDPLPTEEILGNLLAHQSHESAQVRERVAAGLYRYAAGGRKTVDWERRSYEALLELARDRDPSVRARALLSLRKDTDLPENALSFHVSGSVFTALNDYIGVLFDRAEDPDPGVRKVVPKSISYVIGTCNGWWTKLNDAYILLLDDPDPEVRSAAYQNYHRALYRMGSTGRLLKGRGFDTLVDAAHNSSEDTTLRLGALSALGEFAAYSRDPKFAESAVNELVAGCLDVNLHIQRHSFGQLVLALSKLRDLNREKSLPPGLTELQRGMYTRYILDHLEQLAQSPRYEARELAIQSLEEAATSGNASAERRLRSLRFRTVPGVAEEVGMYIEKTEAGE